jgi:Zn-dependent protease/predicted transcriptional regulator
MKNSIKLFTWLGIPVYLHWTFALLVLYITWESWSVAGSWISAAMALGLIVALFGCVLLHEYGHSLMARRYGVQTQDIVLTPIGGIARLERMPEKPIQEFWVAIAGPLVNVAIAAALFIGAKLALSGPYWEVFILSVQDHFSPITRFFGLLFSADLTGLQTFFTQEAPIPDTDRLSELAAALNLSDTALFNYLPVLAIINLMLVGFNLLPIFPMDGGRVLRALLAARIGRSKATRAASMVGQVIAIGFILYAMYNFQEGYMFGLIGVFVFMTARAENAMVQLDEKLRRFKAADLVREQFTRLYQSDWMQTPIHLLRHGLERNFIVFNSAEEVVGVLDEEQIMAAARKREVSTTIEHYMDPDVDAVGPDTALHHVYALLHREGCPLILVQDETRVLGVIDAAGLNYFMQNQNKLT